MGEEHGDWTITETSDHEDVTHLVTGWGLHWACKSLEDARAVAELLGRATALSVDVWND